MMLQSKRLRLAEKTGQAVPPVVAVTRVVKPNALSLHRRLGADDCSKTVFSVFRCTSVSIRGVSSISDPGIISEEHRLHAFPSRSFCHAVQKVSRSFSLSLLLHSRCPAALRGGLEVWKGK